MTSCPPPAIQFTPIGIIHTPHVDPVGTPIQPRFAEGVQGTVHLCTEFADALQDLAGFERIWLIYQFDRSTSWKARVVPFRDTVERGLFATRAPNRPNPIGMSVVRLVAVREVIIVVEGVDMLDGTPLLDIKPYVPTFDAYPEARSGWFDRSSSGRTLADGRYG
jgi:tRNA-Thr(GGU) m(6)t(6)A37 methyltransferase TsaA